MEFPDPTISKPQSILKKYFGYDRFRPLQADVIETVMQKKDCLVLMPTGGGKSVCFQVPALAQEGTCVVISPLIALMKDQVGGLKINGIEAEFLNSSLSSQETLAVEQKCANGSLKLLYISPEKLYSESFQWLMGKMKLSMFAIDEAHCISFWGHDFRPEYTRLAMLKENYPDVPIIALTATADNLTRKDIVKQLRLHDPETFIASFDRPNISLDVLPANKRMQRIIDFLSRHPNEPGIIYSLSRKSTEQMAMDLKAAGFQALAYHAGMDAGSRTRVQDAFRNDDVPIICATIAFGMGIDKSNVRWVIHHNMPKNIESYYQEIGRAGRDGAPAEALLFYSMNDIAVQRSFLVDLPEEQRELQEAKLDRLVQYIETPFCRRKILLNYFNEDYPGQCGNCDNCRNPRNKFDATILAQKALSAIARTEEQVSVSALSEILYGSKSQHIIEKGYDKIKTFGTGKEVKPDNWKLYILQMLNLGIMDIAYDENHHLKLNANSKKVLFNGAKVFLVEIKQSFGTRTPGTRNIAALQPENMDDKLFEKLRRLRKKIADIESLPPYLIFNDNTLWAMVHEKPMSEESMLDIQGIGVNKFDMYGRQFLDEIKNFFHRQSLPYNPSEKGATQQYTYDLLMQGKSPEAIANERAISVTTVYSHIASMYEKGNPIEIEKFLTKREQSEIFEVLKRLGIKSALKEIFEALNQKYDYGKIRIAIAMYSRRKE